MSKTNLVKESVFLYIAKRVLRDLKIDLATESGLKNHTWQKKKIDKSKFSNNNNNSF